MVDNVSPHRVSPGAVIVVTEGRRVVAYFHVESMDADVLTSRTLMAAVGVPVTSRWHLG